jgi:hypothetical protein
MSVSLPTTVDFRNAKSEIGWLYATRLLDAQIRFLGRVECIALTAQTRLMPVDPLTIAGASAPSGRCSSDSRESASEPTHW